MPFFPAGTCRVSVRLIHAKVCVADPGLKAGRSPRLQDPSEGKTARSEGMRGLCGPPALAGRGPSTTRLVQGGPPLLGQCSLTV